MNRHKHIALAHVFLAILNLVFFDYSVPAFIGAILNGVAAYGLFDKCPWGLDLSFGVFGISSLMLFASSFYYLMFNLIPELIQMHLNTENLFLFLTVLGYALFGYLIYLPIKYLKNKETYEQFNKRLLEPRKMISE